MLRDSYQHDACQAVCNNVFGDAVPREVQGACASDTPLRVAMTATAGSAALLPPYTDSRGACRRHLWVATTAGCAALLPPYGSKVGRVPTRLPCISGAIPG